MFINHEGSEGISLHVLNMSLFPPFRASSRAAAEENLQILPGLQTGQWCPMTLILTQS